MTALDPPDGPSLDTTYDPGESATGSIILDVPERAGAVTFDVGLSTGFTLLLPDA